ncbi:unnamed protein product [Nesidiocoris tenuis]|uniref:Uncharacterized protein n=1 Tax=Nesidiocoris tenuis TaxID=355587 RepID=A0A6H5HCM4_9HEMI|nr:unnamed protein product [Nesidiocoris tenuis]
MEQILQTKLFFSLLNQPVQGSVTCPIVHTLVSQGTDQACTSGQKRGSQLQSPLQLGEEAGSAAVDFTVQTLSVRIGRSLTRGSCSACCDRGRRCQQHVPNQVLRNFSDSFYWNSPVPALLARKASAMLLMYPCLLAAKIGCRLGRYGCCSKCHVAATELESQVRSPSLSRSLAESLEELEERHVHAGRYRVISLPIRLTWYTTLVPHWQLLSTLLSRRTVVTRNTRTENGPGLRTTHLRRSTHCVRPTRTLRGTAVYRFACFLALYPPFIGLEYELNRIQRWFLKYLVYKGGNPEILPSPRF